MSCGPYFVAYYYPNRSSQISSRWGYSSRPWSGCREAAGDYAISGRCPGLSLLRGRWRPDLPDDRVPVLLDATNAEGGDHKAGAARQHRHDITAGQAAQQEQQAQPAEQPD